MANLKAIRTRIETVQSTGQITTAMRMVSASKLRKAQQALVAVQPYSDALLDVSGEVYSLVNQQEQNSVPNIKDDKKDALEQILLVVFSSNKGLCGPFNANVVKYTNELIKTSYRQHLQDGKLRIITIGKKAGEVLEKQELPVVAHYHDLLNHINHKDVFSLSGHLLEQFQSGIYQKIVLIYNRFKTVLTQELTELQFLPLLPSSPRTEIRQSSVDFIMEPDKETVLKWLYPRMLEMTLYRTFLESMTSEEGARMTAMQQASDNAAALLKELRLSYNKARQAAITGELLEIIAGAEALSNQ
ncbi:MAG: ATP synthase F1 subunit gamma [Bacteroidales bacterium]|nr:ATP synthase F1 subunit gamma [Bacteroidales bacterium]